MQNLLDTVALVISYFVDWLSNLTSIIIGNSIVQILFALIVIYSLYFLFDLSNQ